MIRKAYGARNREATTPQTFRGKINNYATTKTDALDLLFGIGVQLAFITESAVFVRADSNLTEAGIEGLYRLLNNVMDDVIELGHVMHEQRPGKGEI